jgi:DNA polymerase III epsilon subunit-like protein
VNGLINRTVADVPVAVLDFETTGMWAGIDRVVEVAVVRVEPGRGPELVLDTLVNPGRRVDATFIHGITDCDVVDAPRFEDVAGRLRTALAGCVLAAYNVSFDLKFLEYEMGQVGLSCPIPHMCLMYLRQMLGLGKRCRLEAACRAHGIAHGPAHTAATDAVASAKLWTVYADAMSRMGVQTYGELASLRRYKFAQSFGRNPLPDLPGRDGSTGVPFKARTRMPGRVGSRPVRFGW